MDPTEHAKHFRKLAKENAVEGILYEPRVYFDTFEFTSGDENIFPTPDVFFNGEQFPVRITHLIALMRGDVGGDTSPPETPGQGNPALIQRYGLRVRAHDTYYMNSQHIPLPLFHNVRAAPPDIITRSTASWRYDFPFPLGHRNAIDVEVQLRGNAPASGRRIGVSFHGTGRASGRPYHLSDRVSLTDLTRTSLEVENLRNDGAEIIDVWGHTIHAGGEEDASDPIGDIQTLLMGVQVLGNGTQQNWHVGDPSSGASTLCPAGLFGLSSGQAVVHRLPGAGWIWQPGQGVTPEMLSFDTSRSTTEAIDFAMAGYAIVT